MSKTDIKKKKKENLVVKKEKISDRNPDVIVSRGTIKPSKHRGGIYEQWYCKKCGKSLLESISGGAIVIKGYNHQPVWVEYKQAFTICKDCGGKKGEMTPNFIGESSEIVNDLYKPNDSGKPILSSDAFPQIYKECSQSKEWKGILKQNFKDPDRRFKRLKDVLDKFFLGT